MSRRPAVFHIGYMKTGTTTLQNYVYPHLPGCTFLSFRGPGGDPIYDHLGQNLRFADDDHYLEGTLRAFFDERTAHAGGTLLVSDEMLAGDIWRGRADPTRTAERLHRLFPDAKIIVSVRSQASALRSHYSFYVKKGGFGTFTEFLSHAAPGFDVDVERLEYDRLVDQYQRLFGRANVKVATYESMRADIERYVDDLAEFIGTEVPASLDLAALPVKNRALSAPSRLALRETNRLFRRSRYNATPRLVRIRGIGSLRRRLERLDLTLLSNATTALAASDEATLAAVAARFEESNARLADLTGLPLAELGYPVSRRTDAREAVAG